MRGRRVNVPEEVLKNIDIINNEMRGDPRTKNSRFRLTFTTRNHDPAVFLDDLILGFYGLLIRYGDSRSKSRPRRDTIEHDEASWPHQDELARGPRLHRGRCTIRSFATVPAAFAISKRLATPDALRVHGKIIRAFVSLVEPRPTQHSMRERPFVRNLKMRSSRRSMSVVGSRERARRRPILEGLEDRRLLTNQMSATSFYVPFVVNQPSGAILVAKVSDPGDLAPLTSHFTANVVWGDGTSSGGAIVPDPVVANEFDVLASHLYTSTGYNQVVVGISNSITDSTRQVSFNDPVTEPGPVVTGASIPTIPLNQPVTNQPVATFTDADGGLTASSFTATVDWGDSTTSIGTIIADPIISGQFDVTATKPSAYTSAGNETITVNVSVGSGSASWTTLTSLTGQAGPLAAATSGGTVYAIGGDSAGMSPTATVETYNPVTNTWSSVASLPTARDRLAATTGPDGSIYAIGGNSFGTVSSEVDVYSPILNTWTTVAPLPTARSYLAAATGPDGKIYAIGGLAGSATTEVDAYDPASNTWTPVASLPVALDQISATTGPDGKIYVIGGANSGPVNSVYAYDTSTNTWSAVTSYPNTVYSKTRRLPARMDGFMASAGLVPAPPSSRAPSPQWAGRRPQTYPGHFRTIQRRRPAATGRSTISAAATEF